MAVSEAFKGAIWLLNLLNDLDIFQKQVNIYCDSQSTIELVNNQVYYSKTKNIDI